MCIDGAVIGATGFTMSTANLFIRDFGARAGQTNVCRLYVMAFYMFYTFFCISLIFTFLLLINHTDCLTMNGCLLLLFNKISSSLRFVTTVLLNRWRPEYICSVVKSQGILVHSLGFAEVHFSVLPSPWWKSEGPAGVSLVLSCSPVL